MKRLKNVTLLGDSLAFCVIEHGLLFKVDLCEVAALGDYNFSKYFDPLRGWTLAPMERREDEPVMVELEEFARQLAPESFSTWSELLEREPVDAGDGVNRLAFLVDRVIAKHGISNRALATKLNIQPRSLREYYDGTAKGTMGPALMLALEALANRPTFE